MLVKGATGENKPSLNKTKLYQRQTLAIYFRVLFNGTLKYILDGDLCRRLRLRCGNENIQYELTSLMDSQQA